MTQDLESRVRRASLVTQDEQLEQLFGENLTTHLLAHVRDLKEGHMPKTRPFADAKDRKPDVAALPPTRQETPRRRPVLVAAVTAALLILTVGGVLLLGGGEEPEAPVITEPVEPEPVEPEPVEPEPGETSAIDLAVAYMEARNAYDAEAISELLADGVIFSEVVTNDPADLERLMAGEQIGGFQYSPFTCEPFPREGWVSCEYLADSRFQQAVGYPPIEGGFLFATEDGHLTMVQNNWPFAEFEANAHDPWLDWLRSEHPDVHRQIYDGEFVAVTAETIELLDEYLTLYEDSVGG